MTDTVLKLQECPCLTNTCGGIGGFYFWVRNKKEVGFGV